MFIFNLKVNLRIKFGFDISESPFKKIKRIATPEEGLRLHNVNIKATYRLNSCLRQKGNLITNVHATESLQPM